MTADRLDLLDVLMSQLLAKMSVLSEQKARHYEGVTVHGGERSTVPYLSDMPLIDYWRGRYAGVQTMYGRRLVFFEALEAYQVARRMRVPAGQPPRPDHPLWKQWVAESPKENVELARLFNVSREYIRQVREAYGSSNSLQIAQIGRGAVK